MLRDFPFPISLSTRFCAINLITGRSGGITMSFQNCPELRTNGLFFSTGSCQQIHTAGGKNATTFVWRLRTSASPEPSFGRVQVITVFDVLRDAGTSRAERDVGISKAPMFRSSGRDYVRIWLSCSSDDHFTT